MVHSLAHFRTVTAHRHLVMRYCRRAGILAQGLRHDLSKYSPVEFFTGARYYTDGRRSPNESERLQNGYSEAWLHHKGRNRHHFEYWTDYNPHTRRVEPLPMPDRYLIEMVCDRIAASKIYLKDRYDDAAPLNYFLRGKSHRSIHPETSDKLEGILRLLAEQGEEAVFSRLREMAAQDRRKRRAAKGGQIVAAERIEPYIKEEKE